jgi:hypothetical protein
VASILGQLRVDLRNRIHTHRVAVFLQRSSELFGAPSDLGKSRIRRPPQNVDSVSVPLDLTVFLLQPL